MVLVCVCTPLLSHIFSTHARSLIDHGQRDSMILVQSTCSQVQGQLEDVKTATLRTTSLLDLTKSLFQDMQDVQAVVTRIMTQASDLIDCERCSVFLVEGDFLRPHIFDVTSLTGESAASEESEVWKTLRFPKSLGIAGHVATTGEVSKLCTQFSSLPVDRAFPCL